MKPSLKLNENLLDKSKSYLVAVSYGPDSMALLFSLIQKGYQVEVAHVNYHQRDVSDFEQSQLEQFCLQHDLPLHILDVRAKPKGNFQDQARTIRYDFFKRVANDNQLYAIVTAHHADDHLETALMQTQRQSLHDYYGIRPQSEWQGTPVIRPLLQTFKTNIIEFCNESKINFSIDASNEKPVYTRNKIRLSLLALSEKDKRIQLNLIQQRNLELEKTSRLINPLCTSRRFLLRSYLALDESAQFLFWLHHSKREGIHFPVTRSFLQNIQRACQSNKPNLRIHLLKGWWFEKAYEDGWIISKAWLTPYRIKQLHESTKSLPLIQFHVNSLPKQFHKSVIRSARPHDQLQIKDYKKTFRRLAIDWKIPLFLREIWPVITNTQGKILTIPRYQKKLAKQANNWFEIVE